MKRIEPKRQYDEDGGYPSVVDVDVAVDLSRRGFLGAAVAGGAVLGGALLLPDAAEAGRRRGRLKVIWHFRYRLRGCKHRIEKLVIQSYDRQLIKFLNASKESTGINTVLRGVLKAYKCRDLHVVKRRSAMERALGKALSARYHARTRRRAARPAVTIIAGRIRKRPALLGDVAMPSVPLLPIA